MVLEHIVLLTALRLPELCRKVCTYAGLPVQYGQTTERFVLRSQEGPELPANLMEEAFVELENPCPVANELRHATQRNQSDKPLVFAIERRDQSGKLLGVTWVALSQESSLQAAVVRTNP